LFLIVFLPKSAGTPLPNFFSILNLKAHIVLNLNQKINKWSKKLTNGDCLPFVFILFVALKFETIP
jgi:hypothetical protein